MQVQHGRLRENLKELVPANTMGSVVGVESQLVKVKIKVQIKEKLKEVVGLFKSQILEPQKDVCLCVSVIRCLCLRM